MKDTLLCICLAFAATTLHGCGSSGATTTTTTTSPKPPASVCMTSPCVIPGIKNGDINVTWMPVDPDMIEFTMTATLLDGPSLPAWIAMAWSPDGMMHNSDFVIGYTGCVRVQTNGEKPGSLPNGKAGFNITSGLFSVSDTSVTLQVTRPLGGKNPIVATGNHFMTAAGSSKTLPKLCNSALVAENAHDIHNLVTSNVITFTKSETAADTNLVIL